MSSILALLVAAPCLTAPAHADRPDEGGGYASFDDADVLAHVDSPGGLVRVHFSVDGPSQTVMDDSDGNGVPDFPEHVAATAEHVLDVFAALGFREPIPESDMGLDHLGGSGAFDFYLVDFGGTADGQFSVDDCAGGVCTGHMLMENDFQGYGYPSLEVATEVLTSHELFHAVQAAYAARLPSWMSEGMAVWAEKRLDDGSVDFMWLASAFLEDPGRPVDSPPAGTITAWSYGTALFFEFLTTMTELSAAPELLERMEDVDEDDALAAIMELMADRGQPLEDAFPLFARWNLATGSRAGGLDGWSFADDLGGVPLEGSFETLLDDDNRFYPMATTYFVLEHGGGPLAFVAEDDPTGLHFALHPSTGNQRQPATDAVAEWRPESTDELSLGEHDAGVYYLVGTYPQLADESNKVHICLGPPSELDPCRAAPDDGDGGDGDGGDGGDGGDDGDSGDGGDDGDDDGSDTDTDTDTDTEGADPADADKGSGCATLGTGAAASGGGQAVWTPLLLACLGLIGLGRRRSPPHS